MAAQEITLKFRGDESQIKASLAGLRTAYSQTLSDITKQTKAEAQAAASLQRQRSTALITIWKADTRAAAAEEKRRTTDAAREERERMRAALSLQRQRSAALIAQWRAEQREQVRLAREAARQVEAAQAASQARRSAFISGAVGGVTALIGVSAVSEIRQAGEAWLEYSNKLQTTQIAFTTMMGSAQLAQDHLKELQQFALKTPFQFGELIDASQRMQALGFRAEQVIPILTDVGNAVAAAGGGSERLDRVVLALSQIQSKGKVATQELNQLAESGIPAFKILQETLGKTGGEVRKLVEDGKISSKVFLDAFQKFSQQNFGGLMEAQSKTFSGAMSNIKDALLQTSATAFAPLFERLTQTAVHFSEASQSSKEFQKNLQTVGKESATIFDGTVEAITAFRDAVRILSAAISGDITFVVETLKAGAHLSAAILNEAFAAIQSAIGHATTAAKLHQAAQEELRKGAIASQKAFDAQANTVRTVIAVYREAEERAKALASAQANVGIDIGLAPEFQKGFKRPSSETEDDLTKKTKGSDPAAAAKRIAEIQLRAVLDGIQLEEEGINRSLKRREIEYAVYVLKIEALEAQRNQSVIAGLISEQKAANELRDPNARAVATAEIEARRVQESNKHQSEINKLTDLTEAHKRKQFEATTDVLRDTIAAQLKIAEIGDSQRITAIRALADARVKSEEEAEREILKIRLAAIDREKERIQGEVVATGSITDPEEQLKTRAKLNLELRVLTAERVAIEQDGERDVEAARRRDLSNERKYADELKAIKLQTLSLLRANAQAVIDSMVRQGAARRDVLRAQRTLDTEDENARHKQALDTIAELRRENAESKRTQEEKNRVTSELNALAEAEAERHRLALEGIANPGSSKGAVDQLFDAVNDNLAGTAHTAALAGLEAVTAAFEGLGNAVGQVVESFVLYGSAGTSVRKVTAEILAGVARQAAVKAVFELAEGFAALALAFFGLPNAGPSASAHFTAAAIYAGIAGIAALAGRAVAGDAFKQSVSGGAVGSSKSSASTTRSPSSPTTVELDRSTSNQQAITLNVNVRRDAGSIVEVVVDDHRNNGAIRQMLLSEVK